MYQPPTPQSPSSQPRLQKAVDWHVSSAQGPTRSPGPGKGLELRHLVKGIGVGSVLYLWVGWDAF